MLSHVDVGAIERYVVTLDRHRSAAEYIREHGATYELRDANGNIRQIKPHPMVAGANNTASICLKLEREFGLTHAARVALPTDPAAAVALSEEEELDNLILGITK